MLVFVGTLFGFDDFCGKRTRGRLVIGLEIKHDETEVEGRNRSRFFISTDKRNVVAVFIFILHLFSSFDWDRLTHSIFDRCRRTDCFEALKCQIKYCALGFLTYSIGSYSYFIRCIQNTVSHLSQFVCQGVLSASVTKQSTHIPIRYFFPIKPIFPLWRSTHEWIINSSISSVCLLPLSHSRPHRTDERILPSLM